MSEQFFKDMFSFFNTIMRDRNIPALETAQKYFHDDFKFILNNTVSANNLAEMIHHMLERQKSFVWTFNLKEVIIGKDNKSSTYHTIDISNPDGSVRTSHILSIWTFTGEKLTNWYALVYPAP